MKPRTLTPFSPSKLGIQPIQPRTSRHHCDRLRFHSLATFSGAERPSIAGRYNIIPFSSILADLPWRNSWAWWPKVLHSKGRRLIWTKALLTLRLGRGIWRVRRNAQKERLGYYMLWRDGVVNQLRAVERRSTSLIRRSLSTSTIKRLQP